MARRTRSAVKHDRPPEGSATGPTLQFAIVPRQVPFVNRNRFWSGSTLVKRAPRLWVTADRVGGGVDLWFCDSRWCVRNATHASSASEAEQVAESFYPGLRPYWTRLRVSDRTAAQYLDRLRREDGCSFCRRAPAEHGSSQIQAGGARICKLCVGEFYEDLFKSESS